ncbi:DUF3800 domain-containing protein [Enterobacter hormaechei]
METFSIDESGYTGFDLLHNVQHFQGASAINITHDEANYLIKQHFPKLQAPELKFSTLVRRESYKAPLYEIQKAILNSHKCASYICDKKFLLILMFVDYAIEPFYYDLDFDLYADGGNYMMGNMLYYTAPVLLGEGFEIILNKFQLAMRYKTVKAINELIQAVHSVDWSQFKETLGPLAMRHPSCIESIMHQDVSTDASFTVLYALISRTEIMSDSEYIIEHDRSKNLLQYNERLNKFIEYKSEAEFKQSKIASIKFPLKLREVTQIDSKDSPSVQLADIMIGSLCHTTKQIRENNISILGSSIELYNDNQIFHLLPDIDFEGQKEFRRGTQASEFINFIENEIYKQP